MKKKIELWPIRKLVEQYDRMNFPEYQRESNVWSRDAKQRLVDSVVRRFDIASLYFYTRDDDVIDCVDGRQRIGAIMSFLGKTKNTDPDKWFEYRAPNELYEDEQCRFSSLQSLNYSRIEQLVNAEQREDAVKFVEAVMSYQIAVVMLSDSQEYGEFNLQFARLNLGVIINSGEKLNAMVGESRDECFEGLGKHAFLQLINIPERRFAREQTAAQILAQVFSMEGNRRLDGGREFARTRHYDLQRLFKEHTRLHAEQKSWVESVRELFDWLQNEVELLSAIRSRAVILSLVLLAYTQRFEDRTGAEEVCEFMREFSARLKWQLRKGLDVDQEYRYLIDFQKHVTQASVEKPAVSERAAVLEREFRRWRENRMLMGDEEYECRVGTAAKIACAKELGEG